MSWDNRNLRCYDCKFWWPEDEDDERARERSGHGQCRRRCWSRGRWGDPPNRPRPKPNRRGSWRRWKRSCVGSNSRRRSPTCARRSERVSLPRQLASWAIIVSPRPCAHGDHGGSSLGAHRGLVSATAGSTRDFLAPFGTGRGSCFFHKLLRSPHPAPRANAIRPALPRISCARASRMRRRIPGLSRSDRAASASSGRLVAHTPALEGTPARRASAAELPRPAPSRL
jgi:hypothetical protein